ncbi:MAG: tyrosine-type recombinase/integrase [Spirochaetia bacterium]
MVRLNVEDVDFSLNEILIREAKGRKDRIVPLGTIPRQYLDKWIKQTRAYFFKEVALDQGTLFLRKKGVRFSVNSIRYRPKHYLNIAGITKISGNLYSSRFGIRKYNKKIQQSNGQGLF